VLVILKENIGVDYNSYYADVKTKIYKLFAMTASLVLHGLQGLHILQSTQVRGNKHGEGSLEALDHQLLLVLLPLLLSPLHLNLLPLLLVSLQLI
jgi:hypothetical protein